MVLGTNKHRNVVELHVTTSKMNYFSRFLENFWFLESPKGSTINDLGCGGKFENEFIFSP